MVAVLCWRLAQLTTCICNSKHKDLMHAIGQSKLQLFRPLHHLYKRGISPFQKKMGRSIKFLKYCDLLPIALQAHGLNSETSSETFDSFINTSQN